MTRSDSLPREIQMEVAKVVEDLPQDKRVEVTRLVEHITEIRSGPLPDADSFERYVRGIPDGGERFMRLVEKETDHCHTQEANLVSTRITLALRGQWLGMALTVFLASIATFLAFNGHTALAGIVFATTTVAVGTLFVLGRGAETAFRDSTKPQSK